MNIQRVKNRIKQFMRNKSTSGYEYTTGLAPARDLKFMLFPHENRVVTTIKSPAIKNRNALHAI